MKKMNGWSILIVSVLVALTILAIVGVWTQVTPQYQAKAEVRVRSVIPHIVFRTEDNGRIPRYRSFVNTQVSVMRSMPVLRRVLDHPQVRTTQWYKNQKPPKPRLSLVQRLFGIIPYPPSRMREDFRGEKLRDNLIVRPRRRTEIIDVTFIDSDAQDAQDILDAVLGQYMRYVSEKSYEMEDQLYTQLVDKYKSLENEILGREKVTAELRRRLGTATPEELITAQRVRLDKMQARLVETQRNIKVLEWEIAQVTPTDSNEAHVDVTGQTEHQLARAKYEEQLIVENLAKQQREFDDLFENAQLLEKENRPLLHKRELFDAVRHRLDQKNMERNVPSPVEILTMATVPSAPYRDPRILLTVIVLALWAGATSGVVLLLRRA